jgi:hypothetical protein
LNTDSDVFFFCRSTQYHVAKNNCRPIAALRFGVRFCAIQLTFRRLFLL